MLSWIRLVVCCSREICSSEIDSGMAPLTDPDWLLADSGMSVATDDQERSGRLSLGIDPIAMSELIADSNESE
jgi:hypothetical protein